MKQPDILVFLSDQHAPQFMGGGEVDVNTPNLDQMRNDGVSFEGAYTACPLCVPARMAMLSEQRSSRTGIFTNVDTLPNTQPTFLHSLVASGYETVLVGRMHFIGEDQRHGFMKRIAPDITLVTWKRPDHIRAERGVFARTFVGKFSTEVVGGGESPVLCYDELVVNAALTYLKQPHEKQQFIVIGTYGPHFPYVAPEELFKKYQNQVELPQMFGETPDYMNPCLINHKVKATPEVAKGVRAAYCGMIERMDQQIGQVRKAFDEFCENRENGKVFAYLSDHGDQAGERDLYGKETFFEKSVRIPMIFTGDGIASNKKVFEPVSILDFGSTICDLAGAVRLSLSDGVSLIEELRGKNGNQERVVYSEYMDKYEEEYRYALMLRKGNYKYVTYHGFESQDMLFDVIKDPLETTNLATKNPEIVTWMQEQAKMISPLPEEYEKKQELQAKNAKLLIAFEEKVGLNESERWKDNPQEARVNPNICIAGLESVSK